jgi:hypothetical protein
MEETMKHLRPKVEEKPAVTKPGEIVGPIVNFPHNLNEEAEDELWDAFESADLDGKIVLFVQLLDEGKLDEEYAFEMLNTVYTALISPVALSLENG